MVSTDFPEPRLVHRYDFARRGMAAHYEMDGIEVAGGSSSSSRRFNEKTNRGSVSFQPKPSVFSVSSRGYDYYYYGAGPGN